MTEEQARKASAQQREYPQTMELFDRVREALAEVLFKTPIGASAEREAIYLRVATLDAMKIEMQKHLDEVATNKMIEEYAASVAQPAG